MAESFRERVSKAQKLKNWWNPPPGEVLRGELVEIKNHPGQYGGQLIYIIRNDEDGELVTVPSWSWSGSGSGAWSGSWSWSWAWSGSGSGAL